VSGSRWETAVRQKAHLYDTEARAIARMEYALDVTAWWKWRRKRRIRRHLADMRARSGKWGALMEAQAAYIASIALDSDRPNGDVQP
jgi:hypothetical protein